MRGPYVAEPDVGVLRAILDCVADMQGRAAVPAPPPRSHPMGAQLCSLQDRRAPHAGRTDACRCRDGGGAHGVSRGIPHTPPSAGWTSTSSSSHLPHTAASTSRADVTRVWSCRADPVDEGGAAPAPARPPRGHPRYPVGSAVVVSPPGPLPLGSVGRTASAYHPPRPAGCLCVGGPSSTPPPRRGGAETALQMESRPRSCGTATAAPASPRDPLRARCVAVAGAMEGCGPSSRATRPQPLRPLLANAVANYRTPTGEGPTASPPPRSLLSPGSTPAPPPPAPHAEVPAGLSRVSVDSAAFRYCWPSSVLGSRGLDIARPPARLAHAGAVGEAGRPPTPPHPSPSLSPVVAARVGGGGGAFVGDSYGAAMPWVAATVPPWTDSHGGHEMSGPAPAPFHPTTAGRDPLCTSTQLVSSAVPTLQVSSATLPAHGTARADLQGSHELLSQQQQQQQQQPQRRPPSPAAGRAMRRARHAPAPAPPESTVGGEMESKGVGEVAGSVSPPPSHPPSLRSLERRTASLFPSADHHRRRPAGDEDLASLDRGSEASVDARREAALLDLALRTALASHERDTAGGPPPPPHLRETASHAAFMGGVWGESTAGVSGGAGRTAVPAVVHRACAGGSPEEEVAGGGSTVGTVDMTPAWGSREVPRWGSARPGDVVPPLPPSPPASVDRAFPLGEDGGPDCTDTISALDGEYLPEGSTPRRRRARGHVVDESQDRGSAGSGDGAAALSPMSSTGEGEAEEEEVVVSRDGSGFTPAVGGSDESGAAVRQVYALSDTTPDVNHGAGRELVWIDESGARSGPSSPPCAVASVSPAPAGAPRLDEPHPSPTTEATAHAGSVAWVAGVGLCSNVPLMQGRGGVAVCGGGGGGFALPTVPGSPTDSEGEAGVRRDVVGARRLPLVATLPPPIVAAGSGGGDRAESPHDSATPPCTPRVDEREASVAAAEEESDGDTRCHHPPPSGDACPRCGHGQQHCALRERPYDPAAQGWPPLPLPAALRTQRGSPSRAETGGWDGGDAHEALRGRQLLGEGGYHGGCSGFDGEGDEYEEVGGYCHGGLLDDSLETY